MSRSSRLTRRTWLRPGAGLSRSPRPREPRPRAPHGSVKAAAALVLACEATPRQAARMQGLSTGHASIVWDAAWGEAKRRVRQRDCGACQACGRRGLDVHHRKPRKAGGTSDMRVAIGLENLVLLCRRCHDRCHRDRDESLRARGFWLEAGQDPASVPVLVETGEGRALLRLLPDGSRSAHPPAGVAA